MCYLRLHLFVMVVMAAGSCNTEKDDSQKVPFRPETGEFDQFYASLYGSGEAIRLNPDRNIEAVYVLKDTEDSLGLVVPRASRLASVDIDLTFKNIDTTPIYLKPDNSLDFTHMRSEWTPSVPRDNALILSNRIDSTGNRNFRKAFEVEDANAITIAAKSEALVVVNRTNKIFGDNVPKVNTAFKHGDNEYTVIGTDSDTFLLQAKYDDAKLVKGWDKVGERPLSVDLPEHHPLVPRDVVLVHSSPTVKDLGQENLVIVNKGAGLDGKQKIDVMTPPQYFQGVNAELAGGRSAGLVQLFEAPPTLRRGADGRIQDLELDGYSLRTIGEGSGGQVFEITIKSTGEKKVGKLLHADDGGAALVREVSNSVVLVKKASRQVDVSGVVGVKIEIPAAAGNPASVQNANLFIMEKLDPVPAKIDDVDAFVEAHGRNLSELHSVGMFHRDINPRNYMNSKIIDVGESTTIKDSSDIIFTPGYGAPEKAASSKMAIQSSLVRDRAGAQYKKAEVEYLKAKKDFDSMQAKDPTNVAELDRLKGVVDEKWKQGKASLDAYKKSAEEYTRVHTNAPDINNELADTFAHGKAMFEFMNGFHNIDRRTIEGMKSLYLSYKRLDLSPNPSHGWTFDQFREHYTWNSAEFVDLMQNSLKKNATPATAAKLSKMIEFDPAKRTPVKDLYPANQ